MLIDLRSDTVTQPTPEMKEFMWQARVGDDVFSEDPSVNKLQEYAAELFGMEGALFCPSGTMANQIAIKAQTQPGDEVICEANAHIYYYEGGGIAANSGATVKQIMGDRGVFTALQVKDVLRPSNIHFPKTSLVSVENTCNRGGGKVFDFQELLNLKRICLDNGLAFHLDGARLFNAIVSEGKQPKDFGQLFTSISICLSKGLGAPIGSLLLGNNHLIGKALRIRKVLGGGMRQAGYMAAAGIYALQNNITRLKLDHQLAKDIEKHLKQLTYVANVLPVETNIIVFELKKEVSTSHFLEYLQTYKIFAFEVGERQVRFVTHLNISKTTLPTIISALDSYSK